MAKGKIVTVCTLTLSFIIIIIRASIDVSGSIFSDPDIYVLSVFDCKIDLRIAARCELLDNKTKNKTSWWREYNTVKCRQFGARTAAIE